MGKSLNSIDQSIFTFEYENKEAASRCNKVIEAIFDSQILPEMDNTISMMIPNEAIIQFESLEIDLGKINENELPTELAKRVKTALEEALHTILNFDGSLLVNDFNSNLDSINYLKSALEIYLTKGYFPSWMQRDISFEQIITSIIGSSQNDLRQIIKKHNANESAMARLRYNLDSKTFKTIYSEMESISLEPRKKLPIKDKLQLESSISYKTIDIYRRNIVMNYLEFGLLSKEFWDVNQIDVQNIFNELIQLKDSFLADKLRNSNNQEVLINRIRLLISNDTQQDLNDYLKHYFSNADDYLLKIISDFQKDILDESVNLSVLDFYDYNGFTPWWANEKDIVKLKDSNLDKNQNLGKSFAENDGKETPSKQIKKAIYFIKDEEFLKQWLKEDRVKTDQLLSYINLAPFVYFEDLNPSKWRLLVYTFAFDYYKLNQDKPNQGFNTAFMNFLMQGNKNIPWKEVFKTIYKKIQVTEALSNDVFPYELLPFIATKPNKNNILNMVSQDNNDEGSFDDVGTEIRIYNSGIIILWPFLTRFFEELDLVKNEKIVNEESRNRAVFLLQQLAFNQIDFPEYELVLNKLFVGLPLERYLSPIAGLTEAEKGLCTSLLNGLIANWDKVKSSSTEAIQGTFLQREGILKIKEKHIDLVIEKKGVDVLLSSLSWNISLIKLPWMEKPMHVEWI